MMSPLTDSAVTTVAPAGPQPIRVLFCCDPGYYQHLAVALASLLKNNQRRSLDVIVMASGGDAEAERKLVSVLPPHPDIKLTIRHFGLEEFHALHTSGHVTAETYLRILALDTLPPEWRKIIYLDCDLVVVSALDSLWETELSDHILAGVPDPYAPERPKALGMPDGATYVNAGVLLINVARWREQDLAARVIAYAEHEGSKLKYHDQDAINAVLHSRILSLPIRWNCQARMFRADRSLTGSTRAAIRAATRDPAIIHYTTAQKPWMFTSFVPKQALYRHYLTLTAWRNAPLTRRSLADMPEALYNRIAYACGSSCSFDRFLQTTNAGRVLLRSWQAGRWFASHSRSDVATAACRRIASFARWGGQSSASPAGTSRPVSPGTGPGVLRKNIP